MFRRPACVLHTRWSAVSSARTARGCAGMCTAMRLTNDRSSATTARPRAVVPAGGVLLLLLLLEVVVVLVGAWQANTRSSRCRYASKANSGDHRQLLASAAAALAVATVCRAVALSHALCTKAPGAVCARRGAGSEREPSSVLPRLRKYSQGSFSTCTVGSSPHWPVLASDCSHQQKSRGRGDDQGSNQQAMVWCRQRWRAPYQAQREGERERGREYMWVRERE